MMDVRGRPSYKLAQGQEVASTAARMPKVANTATPGGGCSMNMKMNPVLRITTSTQTTAIQLLNFVPFRLHPTNQNNGLYVATVAANNAKHYKRYSLLDIIN